MLLLRFGLALGVALGLFGGCQRGNIRSPDVSELGGGAEGPERSSGDASAAGAAGQSQGARAGEATVSFPANPGTNPLVPRPDNDACVLPTDYRIGDYEFPSAFPGLSFTRPLWVGTAPGDPDTMFVVVQGGQIFAFDRQADVQQNQLDLFLSLDVSRAGNEEGLLGLAFHPDYADNGRFFVNYSANQGCPEPASRCTVLAEFHRDPSNPRQASPQERRLLVLGQPFGNHNGGSMAFGPDGYLYFGLGDGGSGGDPLGNGQNTNTLLGAISRIDVDNVPEGASYGIPPDNPFADGVGGAPEVWAWGLRNVWRFSFDASTGALWAGDVGQDCFEEVHRIDGPANYGWNTREGIGCYSGRTCTQDNTDCPGTFVDPVYQYGHDQGKSITGGVVYRGVALDELWGAYLFADYESSLVWALRERAGTAEPEVTLIGRAEGGVASFGEDAEGNVYIATFSGSIRAVRPVDGGQSTPLPATLSETGCFSDLQALAPAPGVIPYEINIPFWSDGAQKQRHLALPTGQRANVNEDGTLEFPVGTALIKTFTVEDADTKAPRRLETRFLVRQEQGYRGFTYRWNDAQSDAELLPGSYTEDFETFSWAYPSRVQCDNCHTNAAGYALGFRTQQLDRDIRYGDAAPVSQLAALFGAGYISDPRGAAAAFPALDDAQVPVERRARAYLDVNCAMCHQPDGPGNAQIDLRYGIALADTGTCEEAPGQGDLDLDDARIIAPGAPDRSVLYRRMALRGEGQMPPLASELIDIEGTALLETFVSGLSGCPSDGS